MAKLIAILVLALVVCLVAITKLSDCSTCSGPGTGSSTSSTVKASAAKATKTKSRTTLRVTVRGNHFDLYGRTVKCPQLILAVKKQNKRLTVKFASDATQLAADELKDCLRKNSLAYSEE